MSLAGTDTAARVRRLTRASLALRTYLREPIDSETASAAVRERIAARSDRFLLAARVLLYAESSPYRPLLEHAGCAYGDLEAGVRRDGLEPTLGRLRDAGVRIGRDELKCECPIVRGSLELAVEPRSFDNPGVAAAAVGGTTSGSRSRPLSVAYSLAGLAEEATTERVFLDAHGIAELPTALWLPAPPGAAGVHNVLLRARYGRPPERWLSQVDPRTTGDRLDRLSLTTLVLQSRLHGVRLPRPRLLELSCADELATWVAAGPRRVLRTFVGSAVRVALALRERGLEPDGAVAVVGGEPLTDARRGVLEEVGFRVVARYSSGETGLIGGGCADGAAADDCHLYLDRMAAIDGGEADSRTLLLTALSPHSGKLLLNVDLGDDAVLERRRCSCPLGEHGLDVHLSRIRSRWAETTEGMTVPLGELVEAAVAVAEDAGCIADDVQVRASTDDRPVALVVSPRVRIEDRELVERVLARLGARNPAARLAADVWRGGNSLTVVRAWPEPSAGGKIVPLVRCPAG